MRRRIRLLLITSIFVHASLTPYTDVSQSGWKRITPTSSGRKHHHEDALDQVKAGHLDPTASFWKVDEWKRVTAKDVLVRFGKSKRILLLFILIGRLEEGLKDLTYGSLEKAWINADLERAARYATAISPSTWAAALAAIPIGPKQSRFCRAFGLLLPWLEDRLVAGISNDCLQSMIVDAQGRLKQYQRVDESQVNNRIYERIFRRRPQPLFAVLGPGQLTDLTPKQVGLLLGPSGCALMTAEWFRQLAEEPQYAGLLTAKCAESFTSTAVWEVGIGNDHLQLFLPDNIYSRLGAVSLHESWFSRMTRHQASLFQGEKPKQRCQAFLINAASEEALEGIDEECFLGILIGYSKRGHQIKLKGTDGYGTLPVGIFRRVVDSATSTKLAIQKIFDAFKTDQWQYMQTAQIQPLFEMETFCKISQIANTILPHHPHLQISGRCWGHMTADAQSRSLEVLRTLPTDLLLHAQVAKVRQWQVRRGDQTYSKLLALEAIEDSSLLAKIMTHFAMAVSKGICRGTIDEMTELLELGSRTIRSHITAECFADLGFAPSPEDLKVAPDLVPLQPFDRLTAGIQDLSKVDRETFAIWSDERGSFCATAKAEQATLIHPDNYSNLGPSCTENLVKRGAVTVDILNSVPPSSFANLDAQTARMIDLQGLSDDRFAAISASLTSSLEHRPLAATFTAAEVSQFNPTRVARLNARILAAMPADAFAGFSTDQIKLLKPDAMVSLTAEQVRKFCCLQAFSVDQIRRVGIHYKDTPQDPIAVFQPVISTMSDAHQATYRARTSEAPLSMTSLNIMTICLLVGLYITLLY